MPLPQYTFEGPDGQRHTIEGPEGSSSGEAFKILQGHLGGAGPAQGANATPQPAPADDYRSKLSGALDAALKALAPSWEHNKPGYSPYKPAQPGNMPNDAVNPVGNDAQMTAAIPGAGAARAAMNMPRPFQPGPPPQSPVNINQMPTQQAMQNRTGLGGQSPPSSPVGGGNPGVSAQQGFLRQAAKEAISMGGHAMGGPLGGLAARFAPKVLGLE